METGCGGFQRLGKRRGKPRPRINMEGAAPPAPGDYPRFLGIKTTLAARRKISPFITASHAKAFSLAQVEPGA
jgi:hypothetical protein